MHILFSYYIGIITFEFGVVIFEYIATIIQVISYELSSYYLYDSNM